MEDIKLSSYNYELPKGMIASNPLDVRHDSKLLVYKISSDEIIHSNFIKLAEFLQPDDLLVLNQSKVFPCRLIGKKETGGQCEIFILSLEAKNGVFKVLIRTTRKKQIGDLYIFPHEIKARLIEIYDDDTFGVSFNNSNIAEVIKKIGRTPIPPYIQTLRKEDKRDVDFDCYQTVFASEKHIGSIAAPTAGFHFTPEVFDSLENRGVELAKVTLHVGLGTFVPVKTENILEHQMHKETYYFDSESCQKIRRAQNIIAVGTTSLRALESQVDSTGAYNVVPEKRYQTDIFIKPGDNVRSIGGLVTNFHLPKSTLLMLVSALVGRKKILQLYEVAKRNNYRFYSYGDAMLILR